GGEQQAAVRGEARAGLTLGGEGEPAGGRPAGRVELPEGAEQLRAVLVGLGDRGDHTALGAGGDGGPAWDAQGAGDIGEVFEWCRHAGHPSARWPCLGRWMSRGASWRCEDRRASTLPLLPGSLAELPRAVGITRLLI